MIFIGYACGKASSLPEAGLAWMNFFLLYVSLRVPLFVIMSKTPFAELNNSPFLIATTLGTMTTTGGYGVFYDLVLFGAQYLHLACGWRPVGL